MKDLLEIKGLGKATLKKLNHSGIETINDFLMCFPKDYKHQEINSIHKAKIGQSISFLGVVMEKPSVFFFRKNLSKLSLKVQSQGQVCRVDIFNRHFLSNFLFKGVQIVLTGKFKSNFKVFTASDLVLKKNFIEGIIPQYKLPDIHDHRMIKIIHELLTHHNSIQEPLPEYILQKHGMKSINQVIYQIHQPKNLGELKEAMLRLKYQELIEFSLRIEYIKLKQKAKITSRKHYDIDQVRKLINQIDFELTDSQKKATNEIFMDLKSQYQMNRLLQGDVGSGKTIVAVLAALASVTSGYQVAVMAPTLVLAYQHNHVFITYLKAFGVRIAILTSDTPQKEKQAILNAVKDHQVDIVIGTHALIQEQIHFARMGLAIIDEQHRFGVNQRKVLREKGYHPDLLLMSATPIPRTLAISIFESSDISQITEKPMGRKPIHTKIYTYGQMKNVYRLMQSELDLNHQIYVICPLIEANESSDYFSVEETLPMIKKRFNEVNISVLHGKMADGEKNSVLNHFKQGHTQILISTTVIEVGIHIDNATTMVIMNANAFGLAQLHQLRGRIGRNNLQSYCCLLVDEGVEDIERLEILEKTEDGFEISAFDLKMRGPGEVFGRNQSGVPNFSFANLIEDTDLLSMAQEDAKSIINADDAKSNSLKEKVIQSIDSYHLD
jgi:ATP-dependent DNA helicase RecG